MMPRVDENKVMIEEGLKYLETSWRPGIQALFGLNAFKSLPLFERVSKVNSLLNIRDVENKLPSSFRLLTSLDKKEAEKLAEKLFEKSAQKKVRIREIIEEVKDKISEKPTGSIVFEGSSDWELILLGVVASIITKEEQKPVFLFKKGKTETQGSIRAPAGFNTVEAMKSCSKNLLTYGGHPQAAGFSIKNENLEGFKKCLIEYYEKNHYLH